MAYHTRDTGDDAFVPGGTFSSLWSPNGDRRICADACVTDPDQPDPTRCQLRWPIRVDALVLPDHWHTIWTLPPGDSGLPEADLLDQEEFTVCFDSAEKSNSEHGQINDGSRAVCRQVLGTHDRSPEGVLKAAQAVHYNPS
ncbi:MAG: hypothetical protein R3C02_23140 [Planctomycetaceae bacterium]